MEETTQEFEMLSKGFAATGLRDEYISTLTSKLGSLGFTSTRDLLSFAADFRTRPEVLSDVLTRDFSFKPLDAHRLRAVLMRLMEGTPEAAGGAASAPILAPPLTGGAATVLDDGAETKRPAYKTFVVSPSSFKQKSKRASSSSSPSASSSSGYEYGMSAASTPPAVALQLEAFYKSMVELSPTSQEAPIRPTTAVVYARHAKLFLGWLQAHPPASSSSSSSDVGIFAAFPSKEKEGARNAFDFIKFLRDDRQASTTYIANVIRGLIKLAKYRFAAVSTTDPSYGEKSFDDIPAIKELRKIHRDASIKAKSAPRVSEEKKKWLDWPVFLDVVDRVKAELLQEMRDASGDPSDESGGEATPIDPSSLARRGATSVQSVKIAVLYQQFLVLAFFAIIPDRQRTIRELALGSTFVQEDLGAGMQWIVRHGADDYKTGRAYGARPPLPVSLELKPWVDDFILRWRPHLMPKGEHLFSQSRSGAAMSADSIYQLVSRCCYRHTGKKTNPHLLRDMVVTHVRSATSASEKDLEALALFMGHSLQMQRQSYDRRTVSQKVAPAVALLSGLRRKE